MTARIITAFRDAWDAVETVFDWKQDPPDPAGSPQAPGRTTRFESTHGLRSRQALTLGPLACRNCAQSDLIVGLPEFLRDQTVVQPTLLVH